jgi:hypothetical protein
MPDPRNPATPGTVNGHYLFEAAAIIHQVITSDRSLKGEQVDALTCITGGALQLFLADADNGLIGDLGISKQPTNRQERPLVLSDEFLELERGALLGIHVSQDFVDFILSITRDLRSQLDGGAFPHDEVIGRVRQFFMTTCGLGKMPFIGFYAKNSKAADPKTYKARLRQTEWGLIGVGLITLGASADVSIPGFDVPMTEMLKSLGSTFLGKALF